jgi:hypothetical protein
MNPVFVSVSPCRVPPVHWNRPAGKLNVASERVTFRTPLPRRTCPAPDPVKVPVMLCVWLPVRSRTAEAATV